MLSLFIAIVLACAAAIGFALGAALQHDAVDLFHRNGRVSSSVQLRLSIRNRRWLMGLALLLFSAATHVGAIYFAPVTVVQPIGVLAVPLSVIISQKMRRTSVPAKVWVACGITIAAVTGFTIYSTQIGQSHVAHPKELFLSGLIVTGLAAAIGVSARTFPLRRRTQVMMWAIAAALLYGFSTGLIKAAFVQFESDIHFSMTYMVVLVTAIIATYVSGFYCVQRAYATGVPEIVISVLTTTDPLTACVFGLVLLKEGIGVTLGQYLVMAVFAVIAVIGVAMLSSNHPDSIQHRAKHPSSSRPGTTSERESHAHHDGSRHVRA